MIANIEGLFPRRKRHKIGVLREIAETEGIIMLALTESHLREDIQNGEIEMKGYQHYRADRKEGRRKGGVIVYLRNSLAAKTVPLHLGSNGYVEHVILYISHLHLCIAIVYRPPDCPPEKFNETLERIETEVANLGEPSPNIVVAGDFNLPHIRWPHLDCLERRRNQASNQATKLLRFAREHVLSQQVLVPTREHNILDLFFTSNEELVADIRVEETALSDHRLVMVKTTIERGTQPRPTPREGLAGLNFHHRRTDWEAIGNELLEFDWRSEFLELNAEAMYNKLCEVLLQVCVRHTPGKTTPKRRIIPRDRRILMRKRASLNNQITPVSRNMERRRLEHLKEKIKETERQLQDSHEAEQQVAEAQAVSAIRENPKYFYKYAQSKAKIRASVGPLKNNGGLVRDDQGMCELLGAQFEQVFSEPRYTRQENEIGVIQELPGGRELMNIEFETPDLERSIQELSTYSAPGPDGVPAVLLKKCVGALKVPLTLLWKTSLRERNVPSDLKLGLITPIYKGGARDKPQNYRPVTLTSHVIKVFEKVVARRLVQYMEEADLFNRRQHGFRRNRSCLSQLLEHHHQILALLEDGAGVDVVYLDFAKAFDKVDHGVLFRKLRLLGVGGELLAWIHSFLTERLQAVVVGGSRSSEARVKSGVPQGTVLGPILFLIHIADIDVALNHASASSFADDTRILMTITDRRDCERLQEDLSTIYDWAQVNNMQFNGTKFEVLRYRGSGRTGMEHHYLAPDNSEIEEKRLVRDLGVLMNTQVKFDDHITAITARGRRQMGWIWRTFRTREAEPMITLFRALVIPILEYCCQLWTPFTLGAVRQLEGVQRTFTSRIRGMEELNYWERLRHLGLYSLQRRRERYVILYTWKILTGMAPNFESETFRIETHHNERRGRLCKIPSLRNRSAVRFQSLREGSLSVAGPRLFNVLPKDLREGEFTLETFKRQLDVFLGTIPDRPPLQHYQRREASNSIVHQLAQMRADER